MTRWKSTRMMLRSAPSRRITQRTEDSYKWVTPRAGTSKEVRPVEYVEISSVNEVLVWAPNDARLSVGIGSARSAGDTKNLLTRIDVALSPKSHSSYCPHRRLLGCVKVNGPIIFFHLTNDWSSAITLNAIDYMTRGCARVRTGL